MQKQIQKHHLYVDEEEELDERQREKIRKYLLSLVKKGLVITYAYHCNRCNYVWFPKDFDPVFSSTTSGGLNLIDKKPPKACARCKSKYWNSPPRRKTHHTSKETTSYSQHQLRTMELEKMAIFGHDMLTTKRLRMEKRKIKKAMAIIEKREKELERLKKEFGIE